MLESCVALGLVAKQGCRTAHRRVAAGLIDPGRHHAQFRSGGDSVPTDYRTLGQVAHLLNYPPSDRGAMPEDYCRITRRARQVMERLFWDSPDDACALRRCCRASGVIAPLLSFLRAESDNNVATGE